MKCATRQHSTATMWKPARNKAADTCKNVVDRNKTRMPRGHASIVHTSSTTTYCHVPQHVSLAMTDSRLKPSTFYQTKTARHPTRSISSPTNETTGAKLLYTNGNWMLHVDCKWEIESDMSDQATTENGAVSGLTSRK